MNFDIISRSRKDNFENVIGKGVVPRDAYPQWRQITWSPDNTIIVCSRSNGTIDAFDVIGTQLFTISGVCNHLRLFSYL